MTHGGKEVQSAQVLRESLLRRVPAVGRLLETPPFRELIASFGEALVTDLVRDTVAGVRDAIRAGDVADAAALKAKAAETVLARRVAKAAEDILRPSPRLVTNATGVVVHTNLGRSILSEGAARRVAEAATAYMDLEYDMSMVSRSSRCSASWTICASR